MPQYNDRSSTVITLAAVLGSLSLSAVILRFIARSRTKVQYAADDWLALSSLITLLAWMGVVIWTSQNGAGYALATLPKPIMVNYLKGVYLTALLSTIPITAAKLSILCLYRRLFYNDKPFRTAVTVVGVLCVFWFIAATVAVALKCTPVSKAWYPLLPGTCYNIQAFMVAIECPNSFLDFVIVALPVGVIRGLHLPLQRKILITFIFAMGGFVGVIGFIRVALVYKPNTINLSLLGHWLQIQLSIAVVCACLPTYGPLLPSKTFFSTNVKGWYSSLTSFLGRRQRSSASDPKSDLCAHCGHPSRPHRDHYKSLSDAGDKLVVTRVVGGGNFPHHPEVAEWGCPPNGIKIRNDVEVV